MSDYIFNERDALYETRYSSSFIVSKHRKLLLTKMMDRKKVSKETQTKMTAEFNNFLYKNNHLDEHPPSFINSVTVNLHDFYMTKSSIYIVYEYLHEMSLFHMISSAPN